LVPLRTKLVSGQSVEVVTAKSAFPKPQWLEVVVTGKARTAIRAQLKQLEHEDAVTLGHRMVDRALEDLGTSLDRIPQARLDEFLGELRYPRLEELLADIALGNRMPAQVALTLAQKEPAAADAAPGAAPVQRRGERILITGHELGVSSIANGSTPIRGDESMGDHTAGEGVGVHRMDCPNVADYRKSPDRGVASGWDREVIGEYPVGLVIETENKPGSLA